MRTLVNVAKVLVRSSEGEYLILRSSVWPERPDRSQKPDLPGGEVDGNETHAQAAVRELQEEAGIVVAESQLRMVFAETYPHKDDESVTRIIYRVDLDTTPEVTLSWEHESYAWMSSDEVLAIDDIRDPYRERFRYLHEIGQLD